MQVIRLGLHPVHKTPQFRIVPQRRRLRQMAGDLRPGIVRIDDEVADLVLVTGATVSRIDWLWPMDEPAIAGVVLSAADCVRHGVRRMD